LLITTPDPPGIRLDRGAPKGDEFGLWKTEDPEPREFFLATISLLPYSFWTWYGGMYFKVFGLMTPEFSGIG
jgi:hypothetical protein